MTSRVFPVILAAGSGTRMQSEMPKVLHRICGRSLLGHVLTEVTKLSIEPPVVVVSPDAEDVRNEAGRYSPSVVFAEQWAQRGTGDAALCAINELPPDSDADEVLVLPGDSPLLTLETLSELVAAHKASNAAVTILSAIVDDPSGYGRVVRHDDGSVHRIIEHADASEEELLIDEIATSVYCFRRSLLGPALRKISPDNAQGELYLTDAIALFADMGHEVEAVVVIDERETQGVNDRVQLAMAEQLMRERIAISWMQEGVAIHDPPTAYIDASVEISPDAVLLPNVALSGDTKIGMGAIIGPDTRLVDCTVGDGAVIENSVGKGATIEARVTVGPFAYLRPGTVLRDGAHIGAHTEIKNSDIGKGAKVPHLSYIGDAEVGEAANLGAGTITANYDGVNKHRTKIGARVKTGIHTALIAPVEIGDDAWTGAGAVVTKDVAPSTLVKGVPARPDDSWSPPSPPS